MKLCVIIVLHKKVKNMKKHGNRGLILIFLLYTLKDVLSAQRTFSKQSKVKKI